ncbi:MAG: PAS domain S-box protein, partial [Chloroflexota bacterium]
MKNINLDKETQYLPEGILDLKFREVLEFLPDAIIVLDDSLQILHINSNALAMFGYEASEAIGQNLGIFIPGGYREIHNNYVGKFLLFQSKYCRMGPNQIVYGLHRD